MSVRDDPVLFLRGGKGGNAFGTVAGGNATTTAVTHRLDGPEHAAADDTTRLDATADEHGLLPKLSGDPDDVLQGDGTWANRTVQTLSAELIGDGSSNVFDIGVPYVAGTLIVFVAGIDVNDDLTETDPTTGAIALAFVPELGERITVLGR